MDTITLCNMTFYLLILAAIARIASNTRHDKKNLLLDLSICVITLIVAVFNLIIFR